MVGDFGGGPTSPFIRGMTLVGSQQSAHIHSQGAQTRFKKYLIFTLIEREKLS